MRAHRAPMSPGMRFRVWRRDGFRCAYCGTSAVEQPVVLEVDHVVPVSLGGSNDLDNLATACRACNWRKGPRRPREVVDGVRAVFSAPEWMERRIAAIAARTYSSRSQVIRRLLAEALEREPAGAAS